MNPICLGPAFRPGAVGQRLVGRKGRAGQHQQDGDRALEPSHLCIQQDQKPAGFCLHTAMQLCSRGGMCYLKAKHFIIVGKGRNSLPADGVWLGHFWGYRHAGRPVRETSGLSGNKSKPEKQKKEHSKTTPETRRWQREFKWSVKQQGRIIKR